MRDITREILEAQIPPYRCNREINSPLCPCGQMFASLWPYYKGSVRTDGEGRDGGYLMMRTIIPEAHRDSGSSRYDILWSSCCPMMCRCGEQYVMSSLADKAVSGGLRYQKH